MPNVVRKAWNRLLSRPSAFPSLLRQTALFGVGALLHPRWSARNVRIQWGATLLAEAPDAQISLGTDSILYERARLEAYGQGQISIGSGCILGDVRIHSREKIVLGSNVITSWNVFIQDFDPHPIDPKDRQRQVQGMVSHFFPKWKTPLSPPDALWSGSFPTQPISIGNNVWLGANVTILKGAEIGDDSIVSTGSVVTSGQYPPRSILAGVPARVIRSL